MFVNTFLSLYRKIYILYLKRYNLIIDGVELDNEKFNRLRKIIMYQNLPDFKDDSWVDKAIRKDQEERQKLMSKG